MSVQPPSGAPSLPPEQPTDGQLKALRDTFVNNIDQATTELRLVKNSPHLLDNPTALETIAQALRDLNGPSAQAAQLEVD